MKIMMNQGRIDGLAIGHPALVQHNFLKTH